MADEEVNFEKSGLKRYLTPSPAPGKVIDLTARITISTKSTGISALVNFSMPFFTPATMIMPVQARNIRVYMMGAQVDVTKELNIVSGWMPPAAVNFSPQASTR